MRACTWTLIVLTALAGASQAQVQRVHGVAAAGGGTCAGQGIMVRCTLGEPTVGKTSGVVQLAGGFWYTVRRGVVEADQSPVPTRFWLSNPLPNPATSEVALRCALPARVPLQVTLVDLQGRAVRSGAPEVHGPGVCRVGLSCREVPAGAYLVVVRAGELRAARPLVVVH